MNREYNSPFGKFYQSLPYGGASELARKAGMKRQYLYALAKGEKNVGIQVAARLMAADDRITLGMLCPDHFDDD